MIIAETFWKNPDQCEFHLYRCTPQWVSKYRRFTSPHVHHEKWLKAQFKWQLYIQIMHKNNIHAWSYCKQSDIILKRYIVNTRLGKINHFSTATKNLKLAVKKNLGLSFD